MIVSTVRPRFILESSRLDAGYHCAPGVRSREWLSELAEAGYILRPVGGSDGFGSVMPLGRSKRVLAAPGEASVPYLRPYDVFDYLPRPADRLSASGMPGVESLFPGEGWILQTCSGRNLGPLAYADRYLSTFAISDDMLRLVVDDIDDRAYVYAFLSTPTGQSLLRMNKTGGVIDHLSASDLAQISVPLFEEETRNDIASRIQQAWELRQNARLTLADLILRLEEQLPKPSWEHPLKAGWTLPARYVASRIDSAFYSPSVKETRAQLSAVGGVELRSVATPFRVNRYKSYYVEKEFGRPLVSGRQLLQTKPINLRYLASRSLEYEKYELREGMIAFGADGRAEEALAVPVVITKDREGWLANNHVMRLVPNDEVHPGWLYLAIAVEQSQTQLKSLACGSVVDALYVNDVERVILPPEDHSMGDSVLKCWDDLAAANELELGAVNDLERRIWQDAT